MITQFQGNSSTQFGGKLNDKASSMNNRKFQGNLIIFNSGIQLFSK